MRLIKFAFLSLLTLFLVLSGISLLLPADLQVARNVAVSRMIPQEKVLAAVSDLKAWEHWNTFVRNSGLTNLRFSSPSSGVGAKLSSDQFNVTETALDSSSVSLLWDLRGGRQVEGGIQLYKMSPDSLTIQWGFRLHFKWYPWQRMQAFVYDKKLGPQIEESLEELKRFVENSR